MDKLSKFVEDFGLFGGIGTLLLLASWALVVDDLTNFELAKLRSLSPIQLIATILVFVGLLSMLYQLKRAKTISDLVEKISEDDAQIWSSLISFLRDRRYLYSVMEYEHLPMLVRSIADTRLYIQSQLQTIDKKSSLRRLFEELQEACRGFDDSMTRIDLSIKDSLKIGHDGYRRAYPKLDTDLSLRFPEGVGFVGDVYPMINQFFLVTSIGILRGKFASSLYRYGTDRSTLPGWKSLVGSVGGSSHETI